MSAPDASASAYAQPDEEGRFGEFGGSYVAETLVAALTELRAAYAHYKNDPSFQKEFRQTLAEYVGRPSPITFVRRLSENTAALAFISNAKILNHTGAHKINNAIGQVLLAQRNG